MSQYCNCRGKDGSAAGMNWQTMLTRVDKEVLKQKNCKNYHAHKKQMTMEILIECFKNSDQIWIQKAANITFWDIVQDK